MRKEIAAVQHLIWAEWISNNLLSCRPNWDGSISIPAAQVRRWRQQADSVYNQLPRNLQLEYGCQADRVLFELTREERQAIFAGNLIDAREERGWSQEELANACELDLDAIVRMEEAEITPDRETVEQIAEKLGVSVRWLMTDQECEPDVLQEFDKSPQNTPAR